MAMQLVYLRVYIMLKKDRGYYCETWSIL